MLGAGWLGIDRGAIALTYVAWMVGASPHSANSIPVGDVRIMSFNIFHNAADEERGIPGWSLRALLVLKTIKDEQPDVVGLQEAFTWQSTWLRQRLGEAGWADFGKERGGDHPESVSILYRQDKYDRIDGGHFWFSNTPDMMGSRWGGMGPPRMVTWVRLQREDTKAAFYVYNTHFSSDRDENASYLRFREAELLAQRIAARTHRSEPFVILGDLNAKGSEPPVRYLLGKSGCKEPGLLGAMICGRYSNNPPPFATVDAFAEAHPGSSAGTRCSNKSSSSGGRIDFILVEKSLTNPQYPKIDASRTRIVPAFSRAGCASDHRAVVAQVELP